MLTGENVLDGGFIVLGSGSKTVLIRGLGPSLAASGVMGTLADPTLELHSSTTNAILASNDNWKNTQQHAIEATGIPPTKTAEAALIVKLTAGAYTVLESGKNGTTGIGLVEIYDLTPGVGPELANISTRGFVDTDSNVMIAGFIIASAAGGSSELIVRALGPSLGAFGVANPLADPTLELHDSNGALIAANDNWKSDQQSAIGSDRHSANERRRGRHRRDARAGRLHRDREREEWRHRRRPGGSLQFALTGAFPLGERGKAAHSRFAEQKRLRRLSCCESRR